MYIHKHTLETQDKWYFDWVPLTCTLNKFEKENSYSFVWGSEYYGLIAHTRSFIEHISKNSIIVELADVYVHTPYRNKGNGFLFLSKVIEKIYQTYNQSFPHHKIYLYLQVHKINEGALSLYRKLGFKFISNISKFPKSMNKHLMNENEVYFMYFDG